MGRPKRAVYKKDLTLETEGSVVPTSGHPVKKVTFKDFDGEVKLGFFKALDSTYPELLAKLAVLSSIFARLSLGDRAAEDRLVLDENNKIIGTVSIGLKNFKAFYFSQDDPPSNPKEKEKVIPTTQVLLAHNVMELLITSWFLGNDDLHPGNISLQGLIDWDMYLYWITVIIKGPRVINGWLTGSPPKKINISVLDFENFPVLQNVNITHWPTKPIPDNYNYTKAYRNYEAFIALAKNPILHDTEEEVCAQDQLFSAVLKILLTYDPNSLRERLKDYFGDPDEEGNLLENAPDSDYRRLNYKSLHSKIGELESLSTTLFNNKSNASSMIDFGLILYQQYYDAMYRATVFYKGCDKNGKGNPDAIFEDGVPVSAFFDMLYSKPSMYLSIKKWMISQNKLIDKNWQFDTEMLLEKRYHQIFRDSLVPRMKALLHSSAELAADLRHKQSRAICTPLPDPISSSDTPITNSLDLFRHLETIDINLIEKSLDCDKNSLLAKGTIALYHFNNEWIQAVNDYFGKTSYAILTRDDAKIFRSKLNYIIEKYNSDIPEFLGGNDSIWTKRFNTIFRGLQHFHVNVDFCMHLGSEDGMKAIAEQQLTFIKTENFTHSVAQTRHNCIIALFDWVKAISPNDLKKYINEIITNKYKSTLKLWRSRSEVVMNYLDHTNHLDGDNRLAYILCTGTVETGALNGALVKGLIDLLLLDARYGFKLHFPSVEKAIRENKFDKQSYTLEAIEYARTNNRFIHLAMNSAISLINNAIYQWVDNQSPTSFNAQVRAAIHGYEQRIYKWITSSRSKTVEQMLKTTQTNSKKLANIFTEKNSGWECTSLNCILYCSLIEQMKMDVEIKQHNKEELEPVEKLILQINDTTFTSDFFDSALAFAKSRNNDTLLLKDAERPRQKAILF